MLTPEDARARQRGYDKKRREKFRQHMQAYKTDVGCEMCGYNEHPAALQFDHIDPSTKSFEVSRGKEHSWELYLLEIEKCRVLCANCHAIHTHG